MIQIVVRLPHSKYWISLHNIANKHILNILLFYKNMELNLL